MGEQTALGQLNASFDLDVRRQAKIEYARATFFVLLGAAVLAFQNLDSWARFATAAPLLGLLGPAAAWLWAKLNPVLIFDGGMRQGNKFVRWADIRSVTLLDSRGRVYSISLEERDLTFWLAVQEQDRLRETIAAIAGPEHPLLAALLPEDNC